MCFEYERIKFQWKKRCQNFHICVRSGPRGLTPRPPLRSASLTFFCSDHGSTKGQSNSQIETICCFITLISCLFEALSTLSLLKIHIRLKAFLQIFSVFGIVKVLAPSFKKVQETYCSVLQNIFLYLCSRTKAPSPDNLCLSALM